jgi:hypothetical protein
VFVVEEEEDICDFLLTLPLAAKTFGKCEANRFGERARQREDPRGGEREICWGRERRKRSGREGRNDCGANKTMVAPNVTDRSRGLNSDMGH